MTMSEVKKTSTKSNPFAKLEAEYLHGRKKKSSRLGDILRVVRLSEEDKIKFLDQAKKGQLIWSDLMNGKLASNEALIKGIDQWSELPSVTQCKTSFSNSGKILMDHITQLLISIKQVIQEKNSDELIQSIANKSKKVSETVDTTSLQSIDTKLLGPLTNRFLWAFLANQLLREVLQDSNSVLRDIVKSLIKSVESLSEPAERGVKSHIQTLYSDKSAWDQGDSSSLTGIPAIKESASGEPEIPEDSKGKQSRLSVYPSLLESILSQIEIKEDEKGWNIPPERLEKATIIEHDLMLSMHKIDIELSNRLVALFCKIHQDKDCLGLFRSISDYLQHVYVAVSKNVDIPLVQNIDTVKTAGSEFKILMERFAQNHSLDLFLSKLGNFKGFLGTDKKLYDLGSEYLAFIKKASDDLKFVQSKESANVMCQLLMRTRLYLIERQSYRDILSELSNEWDSFTNDLQEDGLVQQLSNDVKRITDDIVPLVNGYFLFLPRN